MTQEHPITPPPELVQQWWDGTHGAFYEFEAVVIQAARWGADQQLQLDIEQTNQAWQRGADQELEACVEWLQDHDLNVDTYKLRAARRPKPPSLKEKALLQLDTLNADLGMHGLGCDLSQIRRALESLPD